jgi:hypothetical protein
MRRTNGRLVVLVAAVAVGAVITGGALAYRQGPQPGVQADAAPLRSSPSSGRTATITPSKTPSPSPKKSIPVKSTVVLSKLTKGREPQVPYLVGREVRGGAGGPVKIPGTEQIQQVARINDDALAVVSKGNGTELLRVDSAGGVTRTPDVRSIVTTEDGSAAAYVATRVDESGQDLKGATVYADSDSVERLSIPDLWEVVPLAYVEGKVYYQAKTTEAANRWSLYEWSPGDSNAKEIETVVSPTGLSADAKTAASLSVLSDSSSCSNVTAVATGKRLWRTCDYQVRGFTPDGATAIAAPAYQDGYGDGLAAALDTEKGDLLHEWSGTFRQTVAEDDQHLLLLADDGEGIKTSIIRCTITTGACELATPLARGELMIGS